MLLNRFISNSILVFFLGGNVCLSQTITKKLDSLVVKGQLEAPQSYKSIQYNLAGENAKLSDVIAKESGIYIKNYGKGQLGSISLRGTSSSHSQTFWNDFSINSITLGQTDYALIPAFFSSSATVNFGHASIINGSGGIGGSINLTNKLSRKKGFHFTLGKEFGSFNNQTRTARVFYGADKSSHQVSLWNHSGVNDFLYKDISLKDRPLTRQTNNELKQYGFQYEGGFRLNTKNELTVIWQYVKSNRQLPGLIGSSISAQNQFDEQIKTSLAYKHLFRSSFITYKIGGFTDNMFYSDYVSNIYSSVQTKSLQQQVQYNQYLKHNIKVLGVLSHNLAQAQSDGFASVIQRNTFSGHLKWEQDISSFGYDVMLRQSIIDGEALPLIAGVGVRKKLTKSAFINASLSRNYRYPSLNDLYWQNGGNENLAPEDSYSSELGYKYKTKKMSIGLTGFYSHINNWIQWTPNASGLWQPQNLKEVSNRGVELELEKQFKIQAVNLDLKGAYSFTQSINKGDEEESITFNKQLIYVPLHKGTVTANANYKEYTLSYDQQITSRVYVDASNAIYLPYTLPANISIGRTIQFKTVRLSIKGSINNLFNEDYHIVANRPMPGRNYGVSFVLGL